MADSEVCIRTAVLHKEPAVYIDSVFRVKVVVAALGSQSLIDIMVSVDVKQQLKKEEADLFRVQELCES